jgi:quinone-modifying oxidoreductase subunit QmoC
MSERNLIKPDTEFMSYLKKNGGDTLKKCFQCATCSVVCSLSPKDNAFPRKEMVMANWGQKENLLSDPDVWLCHGCTDCNTYCPRGAKPADVLSAVRSYIVEFFAFPKFMGSYLRQPKYLIPLLLIPFIILFAILYVNLGGDFSQLNYGTIIFARFFPHGILEIFFIGGNVMIFSFAGIGLYRYWQNLNSVVPINKSKGFTRAFVKTSVEILTHKNFRTCSTNSTRFWGHILIFYGFIGAMGTAGLALIADLFFDMPAPIPLFHPIKILGNLSGLSMLIGSLLVVIKRLNTKERLGSNTYNDWLLVLFILGVATTGLLTEIMRLTSTPFIAYNTYYIHLVFIFFLLWYAPYSKLAHMFYRTLALVYLRMNDREKKNIIFAVVQPVPVSGQAA